MKKRILESIKFFCAEADNESDIARALLRISTFSFLLYIIPPEIYFSKFIELNNLVSCDTFINYSFKITLNVSEIKLAILILQVSSFFCMLGLLFQFASFFAFLSFSLLFMHTQAGCYSNHKYYPIGLVLLLWTLNSESGFFSLDYFISKKNQVIERKNYIFTFLKKHFSLIFFFAGLGKLLTSGLGWITTNNLKNYMEVMNFFHANLEWSKLFQKINFYVVNTPRVSNFLAAIAILFELSAILLLFKIKIERFIVISLYCFHIGVWILMYINFLPWTILYLPWIFSWADPYIKKFDVKLKRLWKRKEKEIVSI